nr:hypothetical protein CFP56_26775 [Quercus suber]
MEYELNADRNRNWHSMIKRYVVELDSMVERRRRRGISELANTEHYFFGAFLEAKLALPSAASPSPSNTVTDLPTYIGTKMTEQIGTAKPAVFFEYELFEGDPDHLRTVKATPTQIDPWIGLLKNNECSFFSFLISLRMI